MSVKIDDYRVIYKFGETVNEDFYSDEYNICVYSTQDGIPLDVADFTAIHGYNVIVKEWDEIYPIIKAEESKRYCHGWQEITKYSWWEAYEALPPKRLKRLDSITVFALGEMLTGELVSWYLRDATREKYFYCNESVYISFHDLIKSYTG